MSFSVRSPRRPLFLGAALGASLALSLTTAAAAPGARPAVAPPKGAGADADAGAGAKPAKAAKPFVFTGPLAPLYEALRAGRLGDVIKQAPRIAEAQKTQKAQNRETLREEAEALHGEALRRSGQVAEAVKLLEPVVARNPMALASRVQLGLAYRDLGDRARARAVWDRFFDDYDGGSIDKKDARSLRLLGMACRYRGSYTDANETLGEATDFAQRDKRDDELVRASIERASLFLEKYAAGDAEVLLEDALKKDPENPDAHALYARIKLEQGNNVAEAEEQLAAALKIDAGHPQALVTRADIFLDNEQYEDALAVVAPVLQRNPADLEARSARAAALWLLDRKAEFDAEKREILGRNPLFTALHRELAERLVIQHRYDEAVAFLEEAVKLDPKDFYAWGELGSGYLRLGDEAKGVPALDQAWRGDKYNVRTRNLRDLFHNIIPKKYVVIDADVDPRRPGKGGLRLRVPQSEEKLLVPLLVPMIQAEWRDLTTRYGFTPSQPLTLELYGEPTNYAVRTVGLPGLAALGVTFGRVVTGRSPSQGDFNWALMIWHELSHVFAIQLSKSRVPRWFTEGLSEWETTHARPYWTRRTHAELYAALRDGTLLRFSDLNTGFTRAKDVSHIVVAYHEAAVAIDFLVRRFGFEKIVAALKLFGEGKRTQEVLPQVTGQSLAALDEAFRKDLAEQLKPYEGTFFVRPSDYSDAEGLRKQLKALPGEDRSPQAARLHGLLAVGMVRSGGPSEEIDKEIAAARAADPSNKEALLAEAEKLFKGKKLPEAEVKFRALIAAGGDGFDVRQRLGDLYYDQKQWDRCIAELTQAKKLDPDRSEPYERLAKLYTEQKREAEALAELKAAARLDIMSAGLVQRLVSRLRVAKDYRGVLELGELARHLVPYDPELRADMAEAYLELGQRKDALAELTAGALALPEASGDTDGEEPEAVAKLRARVTALEARLQGKAGRPAPKK